MTNPCGRTGEIVARSLAARGLSFHIMERPNAKKREDWYIRTLKAAVEEYRPRVIIPIFFPEILSAHRDEFPGIIIPLDRPETIKLLDDKLSACELAAALDIPMPGRFLTADEVENFPCVFKRVSGQGGDSVYFPGKRQALDCLLRNAGDPRGFLITEFIEGENVCVDALRWDGFFHAEAYRVLKPKGKGVSRLRKGIEAPELVEYARRLLDAVDFHGVCGVDFRVDKAGKAYFLECNPRFSGGIESAIASGFDIPYLYYRLACGLPVSEEDIHFIPGVLTGRIVVAPDSFKGSLTAAEAAEAMASGVSHVLPGFEVVKMPVADGGEGTAETLTAALGGELVSAKVSDPLGRPVEAKYGIAGDLAVIEVAAACGLTLLEEGERNPLEASSRGAGELIMDALGRGCKRFIIGLGGTATNDGGRGMMEVPGLLEAAAGASFTAACDVDNPFVGPEGASRVYGAQKGASGADVEVLEERMVQWAGEIREMTGVDVSDMPGAGAAGGLGGALVAFFGARLERGVDIVLDALNFDASIAGAELVLTGEGCADAQTPRGKVAAGLQKRASSAGVQIGLIAGKVESCPELERMGFVEMVQATPVGLPPEEAMRKDVAARNVAEAAARLVLDYTKFL